MAIDIHQLDFYALLDSDTRVFVQEKAQAIHARLKRTAEDVIAIGQDLIEVQGKLPGMKFSAWLRHEFEMTRSMAYNFMSVARRFPDGCPKFGRLSVSVLYELAAPSTPETIIEQVETGQIPATIPAIREAKQALQQQTSCTQTELSSEPTTISTPPATSSPFLYEEEVTEHYHTLTPNEGSRYALAVDTGTTVYYRDDIHRDIVRNDEEVIEAEYQPITETLPHHSPLLTLAREKGARLWYRTSWPFYPSVIPRKHQYGPFLCYDCITFEHTLRVNVRLTGSIYVTSIFFCRASTNSQAPVLEEARFHC